MITNPTRQRALRGHHPARSTSRTANSTAHHARLAARLTPRDRWILALLHEHRVLTSTQITALAFPSFRSARQRLRELFLWSVLDRFRPLLTVGSAPMHYVLAPAGAAVLAAAHGLDVADLGYRHDRALAIAHSLRLAHTVGVNGWFTALIAHARHHDATTARAWWSQARCARHFGDLVRPDAYGRWQHGDREIEFFLEFDLGTEALPVVAGKLVGYARLTAATAITTPVLVWLPTARREAAARRLLHRAWCGLDHPRAVPLATAAADLLDPDTVHPSPADPVWLPLGAAATTPTPRRGLHHLLEVWPHLPPPTTHPVEPGQADPHRLMPPPPAMPPAPHPGCGDRR